MRTHSAVDDLAGVDDGRGVGAELDGAIAPSFRLTQVHRVASW